MPIIKLSTGEKVHMKDSFTHGVHKALFKAVNQGVFWKQDMETGDYKKELPAENIEFQYESIMPLLITSIEKGGKEVGYSPEWLDELLQEDYQRLEKAAYDLRYGKEVETEDGKKKT